MAPKRPPKIAAEQGPATSEPTTPLRKIRDWILPPGCLALAALISPVSQASLSPVYGSIPASVNHKEAISLTILLGFAMQWTMKDRLPRGAVARSLPIIAAWSTLFEMVLFRYSELLGPFYGPAVTGFVSCHSILLTSTYAAAEQFDNLNLYPQSQSYTLPKLLAQAGCLLYFTVLERYFSSVLANDWHTKGLPFLHPTNLRLLISALFIVVAPSKAAILAFPAFINTTLINTTYSSLTTTSTLQSHLRLEHGWNLLERRWSNTGYLSVLENEEQGYRVMRCDHSLLGGEWLLSDTRREEGWTTNEPIYAVFEMLEAVRLMEQAEGYGILDSEARALVVGLGVGTAPKALLAHGIETTVVELDPVVHKFASKWFDLPANHTAVLQDAVSWVETEAHEATVHPRNFERFDYILHDVFTGGAEPLALFTQPFIRNMRRILAPNGVIAINYAGELEAPLTALILNTIYRVFDNQCRIYGDQPPPSPEKSSSTSDSQDFLNMVVFCRSSPGLITFRKPTQADFLGSQSRQHYLFPRPDWEIPFPSQPSSSVGAERATLQAGDERKWKSQQTASARRHWGIMRTVLPPAIWELW